MIRIVFVLIIFANFLLFSEPSLSRNNSIISKFLPDLQISNEVYINNIKYNLGQEIMLNSQDSTNRDNGRCAFPLNYFIENKSFVNIDNPFRTQIKTSDISNSTATINKISANEKRLINGSFWLKPNVDTKIYFYLDVDNAVLESNEINNNSALVVKLIGSCESELVGVAVKNKKPPINYNLKPGITKKAPGKSESLAVRKPYNRPNHKYYSRPQSETNEKLAKINNADLIVIANSPMTKNFIVKNQGKKPTKLSSSVLVNCEYTDINGTKKYCLNSKKLTVINLYNLEPNKEQTLTINNFDFVNSPPGTYHFEIIADYKNTIDESNENNNIQFSSFKIDPPPPPPPVDGKTVFNDNCSGCHDIGIDSIPQLGNSAEWSKRKSERGGVNGLINSAKNGYKSMPPFKDSLTNEEIIKSVKYLCNCN